MLRDHQGRLQEKVAGGQAREGLSEDCRRGTWDHSSHHKTLHFSGNKTLKETTSLTN